VRRIPIAFLLVGLLGLLAAGGAVLGAFEAPAGADLAVHDGANQTLLADHVEGDYTSSQYAGLVISFDFVAPDHASEVATGPNGQAEGHRRLNGAAASGLLDPVRRLLSLGNFSTRGDYYDSTEPASVLFAKPTRPHVTGTFRTLVQVETGYVVAVVLQVQAKDGTRQVAQSVDYRLLRVGTWTRSSS